MLQAQDTIDLPTPLNNLGVWDDKPAEVPWKEKIYRGGISVVILVLIFATLASLGMGSEAFAAMLEDVVWLRYICFGVYGLIWFGGVGIMFSWVYQGVSNYRSRK